MSSLHGPSTSAVALGLVVVEVPAVLGSRSVRQSLSTTNACTHSTRVGGWTDQPLISLALLPPAASRCISLSAGGFFSLALDIILIMLHDGGCRLQGTHGAQAVDGKRFCTPGLAPRSVERHFLVDVNQPGTQAERHFLVDDNKPGTYIGTRLLEC